MSKNETTKLQATQVEPPKHVSMPQYWAVDVFSDGAKIVSIGNDWLSGERQLDELDERTIIGAAQHLLAFVGYGLPPTSFDPDAQAEPVQAGEFPTRAELLEMLRLAKEASADLRRAGRAEAMAIILKTDPEDQLASCVKGVQNYPDNDYSEHWVPEKVAELLDCGSDNPMASILDRLEGAYWEVQGRTMERIANLERDLAEARAAIQARKPAVPFLLESDMGWLTRFKETTEDDQSYDVPKDAMKRLAEIGAVRSVGFGRYSMTAFGKHVTDPDGAFYGLPLKTYADNMADTNATMQARAHGIGLEVKTK